MATPRKTKASATTEIVLGQAANQIAKAVIELNNATTTVGKLALKAEDMTLLVANKEEEIAALTVEYTEKERQLKVDLELSFKSNTEKVVNEHLASKNYTAISVSELIELKDELSTSKSNIDSRIEKEVSTETTRMKYNYENEVKLIQSEHKAISADNSAKIGTLASQNKFLEEQVTKLYSQLDAERAASIERAKAASVGSINVSPSGK